MSLSGPSQHSGLARALLTRGALIGRLDRSDSIWLGTDLNGQAGEAHQNLKACTFWQGQFFESPTPSRWLPFSHTLKLTRAELERELAGLAVSQPRWERLAHDRSDFEKAFASAQTEIHSGRLKKAVPVTFRRWVGAPCPSEFFYLLTRLLEFCSRNSCYLYGAWDSEGGMLGATPEILFEQTEPGLVQTMALAGTRSNDLNPESLLNDPKERAEHQWVIQGIHEKLAPLGEVTVGETRLRRLSRLTHLETPIRLKNHDGQNAFKFESLVRALHPTPALGAFVDVNGTGDLSRGQTDAGTAWLEDQEKITPRGAFGAPFGAVFSDGTSLCLVAIRNLQWNRTHSWIGAGCGVVEQSVLDNEWDELGLKIASVVEAFGL